LGPFQKTAESKEKNWKKYTKVLQITGELFIIFL
jgi:hypothetical protein